MQQMPAPFHCRHREVSESKMITYDQFKSLKNLTTEFKSHNFSLSIYKWINGLGEAEPMIHISHMKTLPNKILATQISHT